MDGEWRRHEREINHVNWNLGENLKENFSS